jgi:hypothetical protein
MTANDAKRPPLPDADGEARELTDEDFAHMRPLRPGDPVSTVPEPILRADRLRWKAQMLRQEADALDRDADKLAAETRG